MILWRGGHLDGLLALLVTVANKVHFLSHVAFWVGGRRERGKQNGGRQGLEGGRYVKISLLILCYFFYF